MNCRQNLLIYISLTFFPGTSTQASCQGEEYRFFDALVGVWNEYQLSDEGREHIGRLQTELVAGDCAISQSFTSPDGSFSFRSLGFRDANGDWEEHYVLSNGKMASYKWSKQDETFTLSRVSGNSDSLKRLVIYDISFNSYYVVDEVSADQGVSWRSLDVVHTVRQEVLEE